MLAIKQHSDIIRAAALIREASSMVEQADALLSGFVAVTETGEQCGPADGSIEFDNAMTALDLLHFMVRHQVRLPVDRGLAA